MFSYHPWTKKVVPFRQSTEEGTLTSNEEKPTKTTCMRRANVNEEVPCKAERTAQS